MKNGPYELVVAPQDYPGMKYRGRYCYEHHLVYWQAHGIVPEPGQVIHHLNGDRRDNRSCNLELMDMGEHTANHCRPVEMVLCACAACGGLFESEARYWRYKKKQGQKRFYCSRQCGGASARLFR